MMNKVKNSKGFTLIEVIVTILLMSIVGSLIFTIMNFGINSYEYGNEKVEGLVTLRMTAMKMTDEIRNGFDVELADVAGDLDTTPNTGMQNQFFYCDEINDLLMYNDNGTLRQYASNSISEATFSIDKVEQTYYKPDGTTIKSVEIVGYSLTITLVGSDLSETITTDLLLNNMMPKNVTIASGDLNVSKKYIGFNHDLP